VKVRWKSVLPDDTVNLRMFKGTEDSGRILLERTGKLFIPMCKLAELCNFALFLRNVFPDQSQMDAQKMILSNFHSVE
jgi:hypothetical protein